MGFCVPLQRHEKRRHWVWLLNIHLHFPLYGHNMLGLINFSQRWSSAHHLLGDNHICMPLRIIPLLLKLQSYSSQKQNFQALLPGIDTKVVLLQLCSGGQGQAPQCIEAGAWGAWKNFVCLLCFPLWATSSLRNYFQLALHHLLPKLKILHASFKSQLKNNCSAGASSYSATS